MTYGEVDRLLINVPPGFMKSMTVDVFWPAWEWGPKNLPHIRYVASSYSEKLTVRDNRKTRSLITSNWYRDLWGNRFELETDQNAKIRFDNDRTGFKIATSVGGLGTGERGDRFIIDDPHNVKDGESQAKREETILWLNEVVPTRLNDPDKDAIIIIMQRVHDRDASGEVLSRELGYTHLMIPMEFEPERRCYSPIKPSYMKSTKQTVYYHRKSKSWQPQPAEGDAEPLCDDRYNVDPRNEENELAWASRFPRRVVERDKKAIGSYAVAGQLQQRPSPRGGGMFQKQWFQFVKAVPAGGKTVRGWDLAATEKQTAAWTAGIKIKKTREGNYYIMDCVRFRGTPGKVEQGILNTASQDGLGVRISIPQDPGQAGKAQKRYLAKKLVGYDVRFSPETGDKETRATPLSAQAEAGNVYVLEGPWNEDFFDEITVFPASQFKDQTDGASRAFAELEKMPVDSIPAGGVVVDARNG